MKCFFQSIDVGSGDCNMIRLVNEDKCFNIMVDCGSYNTKVKEYVKTKFENHIDILVITHIDGDHIGGVAKLLKEHQGLEIEKIWYNAYRRREGVDPLPLNDSQKNIVERLRKKLPIEVDAFTGKREISDRQGMIVAKTLLESDLKDKWNVDYVTADTADVELRDGFGKIVFLGPQASTMKKIDKKFKDLFNKYFMEIWKEGMENSETIFEILLRICEAAQKGVLKIPIAAQDKPKLDYNYVASQIDDEDADDSETNESSIAFMLECGDHKIALLGDSFDTTIVDVLNSKYKNQPVLCDMVKVAHHGSSNNNSTALHERLSSGLYIIPGGKGCKYPTWGTIGRIALKGANRSKKQIYLNHSCEITKEMSMLDNQIQDSLNIELLLSDVEHELFEI